MKLRYSPLIKQSVRLGEHINPHKKLSWKQANKLKNVVNRSKKQLEDGTDAVEKMRDSEFLAEFRKCAASTTRGCILLEDPEALWRLVHSKGARDSSGRGTAHSELAAMRPLPGHNQPGQEIAERSWPYRFAKRNWFFGFGAYG